MFLQQMILGFLLGIGFGWLSKLIINKINLGFEGLYPVLVIALMFITFSFTDLFGGNGFLAVYLCAVYLGNQELIHKNTILKMFDGLAWLMQIVLFLTLGLLVNPSEIIPFLGVGILISLFLIIIARPVSVFIALLPFKMNPRRRWYISWVGLRGAVPIVFATYPLIAGIEKAHMIFNIVFFISLTSVLIQGTSLTLIAKWLHVLLPEKVKQKTEIDLIISESPKNKLTEIELVEGSTSIGKKIVELGFPKTAIIATVKREGKYITPKGNTELKSADHLMVLAEDDNSLSDVYQSLGIAPKSNPDQSDD
jgi:cell volume regulation protein A